MTTHPDALSFSLTTSISQSPPKESNPPQDRKPVRTVRAILGSSPRPTMENPDVASNVPIGEQQATDKTLDEARETNDDKTDAIIDLKDVSSESDADIYCDCDTDNSCCGVIPDYDSSASDNDSVNDDDTASTDTPICNYERNGSNKRSRTNQSKCAKCVTSRSGWLLVVTSMEKTHNGHKSVEVIDNALSHSYDRLLDRLTDLTIRICIGELDGGREPPSYNTLGTSKGNQQWFIARTDKKGKWEFNRQMDITEFPLKKFLRFSGNGTNWLHSIKSTEVI